MNKTLIALQERGFIKSCTDIEGLSTLMDKAPISFYVGCDPTGSSLHVGHMVPFFALRHLKEAGHNAIALIGGGTARLGDPSGKTEMRKLISYDEINENAKCIEAQLRSFFGQGGKEAVITNNRDWLAELNYIDFLRDIGKHFSVNRMLSFEAYKIRMESGLSFTEFNYQLLQSYDFLILHQRHDCVLQIGGDDQWGNIVSGIDLIRRVDNAEAFGLTFPLITTADGKKMGKTEKGAIFIDKNLTPVFEFFQFWRNTQDADVRRFLLMFTFLSIEEIDRLCEAGADINAAKERLALEISTIIHGKQEAEAALAAARSAFSGSGRLEDLPTCQIPLSEYHAGIGLLDLCVRLELATSKSEARRLIQQGGLSIDGITIKSEELIVGIATYPGVDGIVVRAGKKKLKRAIFR